MAKQGTGTGAVAPSGGLRTRKRAAARSAIERAAIDLVLAHGYEHVTVDMICAAGMVSQRTFFNYFGSKEGVFLGSAPAAAEDVARDFLADRGTPVVLSLARAVVSALVDGQADPGLARGRMSVIMGSPELLAKQSEWMALQESQLADLVLERYRTEARTGSGPDLVAEARLVAALALAVVRVAVQQNHVDEDGACLDAGAMDRSALLLDRIFGTQAS